MHRISLIILASLLVAAPLLGDSGEIIAAEKAWAAAVTSRDYAALDKILDDDLIYAHSTGSIESKSVYIGKLKNGAQRYDVIEHLKTTVKMHGDAAAAHSIVIMKGNSSSGAFDNRLMMMHLWVKEDGRWRLAAHQTTHLPR